MPSEPKDISGQRFGKLVAIELLPKKANLPRKWSCVCDCGAKTEVRGTALRAGEVTQCKRCAELVHRTHGFTGTPTYAAWCAMMARCYTTTNGSYENYGAKGIRVCDRWHSFESFLADMGERPKGMTVDRKKNEIGYEPGNCRWATTTEQNRNKTTTLYLTHQGITLTIGQWAEKLGIPYHRILYRSRKLGYTVEEALRLELNTHVNKRTKKHARCVCDK